MIKPTSEPLAIRMASGVPCGASARRYAPVPRLQRDAPNDGHLIGVARTNVVGKNQKCRAERQGAAVRRQTIQDRPHPMPMPSLNRSIIRTLEEAVSHHPSGWAACSARRG